MKLLDGTVLENVKISLEFAMDIEGEDIDKIEVHIQGMMEGGWYSNLIALSDLSSVLVEEDLVRVKFNLMKMNGVLRIK